MAENEFDVKVISEELQKEQVLSSTDDEDAKEWQLYVIEHKNEVPLLTTISDDILLKYYDKVYDYIKDYKYCQNCPGLDKCDKEFPHRKLSITYTHGIIQRQMLPCEKSFEDNAMRAQFQVHDYPDEWNRLNGLDNLDYSEKRESALTRIKGVGKSAYLYGADRTGKTYFAAMIANDLARTGQGPICFLDSPSRIKEISDAYKEAQKDLIKKYQLCNILILDNFGDEYMSDYIRDAIINPILSFRFSHDLLTIIVSRYHLDQIRDLYGGNTSAGKIKASQLVDSIRGACGGELELSNQSGLYR